LVTEEQVAIFKVAPSLMNNFNKSSRDTVVESYDDSSFIDAEFEEVVE
jgi:hypothetical protein